MPKKLSVITINFNNHLGLVRTANSILTQSARHSFEWIVIDGASTDASKDWLNKNSSKIDILISEPDQGIYDAMNKGIEAASGEYIWFMNSGDAIFEPSTVEKLLNDLDSNMDVYFSDTMFIDQEGKELGLISALKPQRFPQELRPDSFRFGMNICHQSFVARKKVVPRYNLEYRLASDIDWIIQILKKAPSNQCCKHVLSRFETGGSSYQNTNEAWKERYKVLGHHYGKGMNIIAHAFIVLRRLFFKIGIRL